MIKNLDVCLSTVYSYNCYHHFSLSNVIGILLPPVHHIVHTDCAGCGLVQYCSKECQKRHWKQHKVECGKCDISFKKLGWRMDQFGHFYNPLIHKLVLDMHRFYNKEMDTGDVLFPEDVIVEIQLADLPRSAKRPRLYIKKVFLAKLTYNQSMQLAHL